MRLCAHCGQVETHSSECPHTTPSPKTAEAKNEAALKAVQAVAPELARLEPLVASAPEEAILRATSLEAQLERHPAANLQGYADKRAHNELAAKLAQKRAAAAE